MSSSPIHSLITGSFTSAGTVANINLPSGYDKFEMINISNIGSTSATQFVMRAEGTSQMLAGSAYYNIKTNGAATNAIESTTLTGGFTFVSDSGSASPGAQLTGQSLSSAAPGVVGSTNTSTLGNGNIVRLYNVTNDQQLSGMDFTVGSVIANTSFALSNLDTTQTNLGVATTLNYRIIPFNPRYYPVRRNITNIGSSGSNSIITLGVTHGYTVGQAVRVYVPTNFGTGTNPFISGSVPSTSFPATIVAIGTADASGFTNTITVNINSAAFTWLWPTSASFATGSQVPFVEPIGEAATTSAGSVNPANLLDDATVNTSFNGVQIGTTVQTSGSVYQWFARKGVQF